MEFKHLTASQFCRGREFKGYNPEDLRLRKTTTFTTRGRCVASYIISNPAGDLHGGVRLLTFAQRRVVRSEHLLEPSAVLQPEQAQETTEWLLNQLRTSWRCSFDKPSSFDNVLAAALRVPLRVTLPQRKGTVRMEPLTPPEASQESGEDRPSLFTMQVLDCKPERKGIPHASGIKCFFAKEPQGSQLLSARLTVSRGQRHGCHLLPLLLLSEALSTLALLFSSDFLLFTACPLRATDRNASVTLACVSSRCIFLFFFFWTCVSVHVLPLFFFADTFFFF